MNYEKLSDYRMAYDIFTSEHMAKRDLTSAENVFRHLPNDELEELTETMNRQTASIAYLLLEASESKCLGEVEVLTEGSRERVINPPGLGKIRLVGSEKEDELTSYYLSLNFDGNSPLDDTFNIIASHGDFQRLEMGATWPTDHMLNEETLRTVLLAKAVVAEDALETFHIVAAASGIDVPPLDQN